MIHSIRIRNFKALHEVSLPFGKLTLLTGANSSGKSSVLQALLLADDAAAGSTRLQLNDHRGLALGEALDVLCRSAEERHIEFSVTADGITDTYTLGIPAEDRALVLELLEPHSRPRQRRWRIGSYLGAERLGPRDLSGVAPGGGEEVDVGARGEYTAYALAHFGRRPVAEFLQHPSTNASSLSPTLGAQAEAWLSSITRPVQVSARRLDDASGAVLSFRDPDVTAEWTRPANVGFGLTCALPIIVAGLGNRTSSLLMVENPEAHLHPRGQSEMGKFLVRLAASGVQTLVETHSDHVVNGVRIAAAGDGILSPDEVAIHYLADDGVLNEIAINRSGGLSAWPSGFFDQAEHDLAEVSRIRRRG